MNKVILILASQSPRRRQLLQLLNMPFTCMVANVDEESITNPDPAVNVVETAQIKGHAIAGQYLRDIGDKNRNAWIIAADTTVALKARMLNKPKDADEARSMLQALRNRAHEVHTGVVLLNPVTNQQMSGVNTAVVTMRDYTNAEIDDYIATGDPLDKAGAYAIQHPQFRPVATLDGCFMGVMGLSICHLIQMMNGVGLPVMANVTAVSTSHAPYPACDLWHQISL